MKTKKRTPSRRPRRATSHHDPDILRGIARGPWSDHWATQQEEAGESFSGQDVYDLAPDAPKWARDWAVKLADVLVALNNRSLADLYQAAVDAGFNRDEESFGVALGLQCSGHGVSWDDDIRNPSLKIKYPSTEFYDRVSSVDTRFIRN